MRWYEMNSEQIEPITDALVEYHKRLTESIDSARKAGLSRCYEQEKERLNRVQAALDHIREIRKSDRDGW